LNRHLTAILKQLVFDTEIFIDVLDATAKALCQVSPRRLADDAYSMIYPPVQDWLIETSRSPLVELWESIPAITRVNVERLMQGRQPSRSLVAWLNTLFQLLDQERPVQAQGAPPPLCSAFLPRGQLGFGNASGFAPVANTTLTRTKRLKAAISAFVIWRSPPLETPANYLADRSLTPKNRLAQSEATEEQLKD
jgi:hypothetical protein